MAERYSGKRQQVRDYAIYAIQKMLSWAQKNYELSDRINDPVIITSFDKKRMYSYGGWTQNRKGHWCPYINLSLYDNIRFKPAMLEEYDWYKDDPVIGERWAKTWKYSVRTLVAHEVAHILEMAPIYLFDEDSKKRLIKRFGRSKLSDDHSDTFQKIYRVLRRKYANRIRKI